MNLASILGKSAEARERRLIPEIIEDFFTAAGPIAGVNPRPVQKDGHVYRVGKIPRTLAPIGERLEGRFGKLGREYQKIVFDKALLPADPTLGWVTPGHPLFEAVRDDVTAVLPASKSAVFPIWNSQSQSICVILHRL